MKKFIYSLGVTITLLGFGCSNPTSISVDDSRNSATDTTIARNNSAWDYLKNSEDSVDFQNATRGFICTTHKDTIMEDTNVIYNLTEYDFIEGEAPDEVNKSLWRQSSLNKIHGFFQVRDSVYQVRGFDLANMTLILGTEGWIIIDPLSSPGTAAEAVRVAQHGIDSLNLGPNILDNLKAIIFTHSHIDHFGGVKGITNQIPEGSKEYTVYAPKGFYEHSISENIMAGNAMSRRASYMYGNLLPKDTLGTVGTGLGQTTSTGLATILEPDVEIESIDLSTDTIAGLTVEFIYTPESEAPAEMMFYFPELKTFCQSEDVNHTLHNLYTLRGAKVRNGQKWSQYIDKAILHWGDGVEYSFGSHHWPTWGHDTILQLWENQRDMYRFLHDQTLRLANIGYTSKEIADSLQLPKTLDTNFYNRGYYGTVSHNAKAQYQLYFGWFDGNPANLNPLTPVEEGKKYVEFMGGANEVIRKAKESIASGEYRWAAQVLNHLVFAEPDNDSGRLYLAATYEQLGYQAESGPWRNFYLSGAQELRKGVHGQALSTASPDIIAGMDPDLLFNYIAMRFIGTDEDAAKMDYKFNIFINKKNSNDNLNPSTDLDPVALIVKNGAVTPRVNYYYKDDSEDASLLISRSVLDDVLLGKISIEEALDHPTTQIKGQREDLENFFSKIQDLTEKMWFNIIEP